MPRDGSGNFSLPAGSLAVTGATILASQHNTPINDIATALTGSLPRNGTAPMGANLAMAGFKITGLADAEAATDAVNLQQLNGAAGFAVTLAGAQTLTNKTITQPVITLKQSAAPAPTVEGDIQWDTDDNVLAVGDGALTKLFVPIPASTAAGDIEYFSAAKVKARLAKGAANQVLTMNTGATAPQWKDIPDPAPPNYGTGNAALGYGAVGTYAFMNKNVTGTLNGGATISGSSLDYAAVDGGAIATSGSPSGTWRSMGATITGSGKATLFLRIS